MSLGARGERRAQEWKRGCGRPRREPPSPGTRFPGGARRRAPLQAAPSAGASRGRSRPRQGQRAFPQKVGTQLRSRPPPRAGTPLPLPAPRYPHLPPRVTEGREAPPPPPGVDPVPAEPELPAGASLPSAGAEQPTPPTAFTPPWGWTRRAEAQSALGAARQVRGYGPCTRPGLRRETNL